MTKNRIAIATIICLLLGVIIGGRFTTNSVEAVAQKEIQEEIQGEELTLTIGYLPITHALPIFKVAEMLEQEEKGIKIKLQKFSSWTDLTDALHAGKIDGASELIELAMSATAKGIDLKAVALGHKDGNVIIISNTISSEAKLEGKTFAIPSKQSSHYILLKEQLKKVGVDIKDIKLVQLAPSEMPSSLASGAIDGYCVAEPFGAQAISQGFGKVLSQSNDLWEESLCCALIFRSEVIEKNEAVFQAFLNDYEEAGKALDREEAKRIATLYLGQDERTLETSLGWISYDDLTISKEAYEVLCKKVIENEILDTPPSFEDFVYQG